MPPPIPPADASADVVAEGEGESPTPLRAAAHPASRAVLKGVGFSFLSFAVFSCGDSLIKALGGRMSVFEIAFFATLVACVSVPLIRHPSERWRDMFRMHRPGLVLLRAVAGVISGIASAYAFTTIPLAEAYALIFLSPLFVTILSIPFLGETIGWRRGLAILIGFAGVLLVVRPGFRELVPGHLAAVANALCGATMVLVLRALGPTEKRITLIGVVFAASLVVNGTIMAFDFHMPAPRDLLIVAAAGLCGGAGHLLIMAATRAAPANRIAPTQYSQIVWAVILGALFFNEFPDATAFVGIGLVIFAGVFTFIREEKRGGRWPAVWAMVWPRSPRGGA